MTGNIQFEQVRFIYPSRPKVYVLKNFDLLANASQTTALCGPSGSGYIKSSPNFLFNIYSFVEKVHVLLFFFDFMIHIKVLYSSMVMISKH
jgi:ATP-binding cassette subfamily B (MDR/TAP) protein 1